MNTIRKFALMFWCAIPSEWFKRWRAGKCS